MALNRHRLYIRRHGAWCERIEKNTINKSTGYYASTERRSETVKK
jgi:hypothetical protein